MQLAKLKYEALRHRSMMDHSGWLRRFVLKMKLRRLLNEIEYREGRLQYANRPYVSPTAILPAGDPFKQDPMAHKLDCRCGCWVVQREKIIGM